MRKEFVDVAFTVEGMNVLREVVTEFVNETKERIDNAIVIKVLSEGTKTKICAKLIHGVAKQLRPDSMNAILNPHATNVCLTSCSHQTLRDIMNLLNSNFSKYIQNDNNSRTVKNKVYEILVYRDAASDLALYPRDYNSIVVNFKSKGAKALEQPLQDCQWVGLIDIVESRHKPTKS